MILTDATRDDSGVSDFETRVSDRTLILRTVSDLPATTVPTCVRRHRDMLRPITLLAVTSVPALAATADARCFIATVCPDRSSQVAYVVTLTGRRPASAPRQLTACWAPGQPCPAADQLSPAAGRGVAGALPGPSHRTTCRRLVKQCVIVILVRTGLSMLSDIPSFGLGSRDGCSLALFTAADTPQGPR